MSPLASGRYTLVPSTVPELDRPGFLGAMILSDQGLSTATETVIPDMEAPPGSWWPVCWSSYCVTSETVGGPRASSPLAGRAISKLEIQEESAESAADSPEEGRGISRLAAGLKHTVVTPGPKRHLSALIISHLS